jgi:hypothetical protein
MVDQHWKITGNPGTNEPANFLGTTDNEPLVVKTNGTEAMRIDSAGHVGIGTTQPRTPLHVLGRISTGADFTSAGAITFFPRTASPGSISITDRAAADPSAVYGSLMATTRATMRSSVSCKMASSASILPILIPSRDSQSRELAQILAVPLTLPA